MNAEAKKAVVAMYKRLLKEHLPGYSYVRAGVPHRSTFEFVKNDNLRLQIYIHWQSYSDEYTLEVGWTYKSTQDDVISYLDPIAATCEDAVAISLSVIAGQEGNTWWDVQKCYSSSPSELNDANIKFMKLLRSSFQVLQQIGIPYLDRVVTVKLADEK